MNKTIEGSKHILICPLDWGLGHATRCIPLIRKFLALGKKVSVAGNGNSLILLDLEFPLIKFYELKGYNVDYPKNGQSFLFQMALQSPKIASAISTEKKELNAIINNSDIDLLISDNRYGCFSNKVHSVFLGHQLQVKFPNGLKWLNKVNEMYIKKFDEIWVPDHNDGSNLSGDLSHNSSFKNVSFIGPQSRFSIPIELPKIQFDLLGIISGPEPQRGLFEKLLVSKMLKTNLKCVIVRGRPNDDNYETIKNIQIFDHLSSDELQNLILTSENVICRSGYSSIMDLYALKKHALLIPTPGQIEQEYLGAYLNGKFGFNTMDQNSFERFELTNEFSNVLSN